MRTPYPKGGDQEELPYVRGQGQRPRVPDCDGTGTAERSYPAFELREVGREEIPSVRGRGGRREEILHAPNLKPGAAARRTNHTSKEPWLRRRRRS